MADADPRDDALREFASAIDFDHPDYSTEDIVALSSFLNGDGGEAIIGQLHHQHTEAVSLSKQGFNERLQVLQAEAELAEQSWKEAATRASRFENEQIAARSAEQTSRQHEDRLVAEIRLAEIRMRSEGLRRRSGLEMEAIAQKQLELEGRAELRRLDLTRAAELRDAAYDADEGFWAKTESHRSRHREDLGEKRGPFAEHLTRLEALVRNLHLVGISEPVASVQRRIGYFTLPILGWWLGTSLQGADADGILPALSAISAEVISTLGAPLGILVISIGVPALIAGLGFLTLFAALSAARVIRRRAGPERSRKPRRRRGSDSLPLGSPFAALRKSDYPTWVIASPLLLAGLAFVLFAGAAASLVPEARFDHLTGPIGAVYATSIGFGIMLILSGIMLSYTTIVILPRVRGLASGRKRWGWRGHWEIKLLAAVTAASVVAELALLRTGRAGIWSEHPADLILLLGVLNSFVLAQGIVYGGIFREMLFYRRHVNYYDERIDEYSRPPHVRALEEETQTESLSSFYQRQHDAQDEDVEGDDVDADEHREEPPGRLGRFLNRVTTTVYLRRSPAPPESEIPELTDEELAVGALICPEEFQKRQDALIEYQRLRGERSAAQEALARIGADERSAREAATSYHSELRRTQESIHSLRASHLREQAELTRQYQIRLSVLRNAEALGRVMRQRLAGDGVV